MSGSDRPPGGEVRTTDGHHLTGDELNRYLDRDLAPSEAAAAEAHLAYCELCRSALAELRVVLQLLSSLPEAEVPRSFQLGPEYASQRRSWLDHLNAWLMPALPAMRAATIAVALTLGGLTAWRAFDDQPQTGPVAEQPARDAVLAPTEPSTSRVAITSTTVAVQPGPAGSEPEATQSSAAASSEMQAPAPKTGGDESAADDAAADEASYPSEAAGSSSASEENSVMVAMEAPASPAATDTPAPVATATPAPQPTPTPTRTERPDDDDSWIENAQWILGVLLAGLAIFTVGLSVSRRRSVS